MAHAPGKVAVIVGATSKWQADGANTRHVHGGEVSPEVVPVSARWGVGGGIAQKFAAEGYETFVTSRRQENAEGLAKAIMDAGGRCHIVTLDVAREQSIAEAFAQVREIAGEPDIVVYNVGYMDGREIPAGKELLEHIPTEMFDLAIDVAARGPFLVAKEVLPAMRRRGSGSLFFSNNTSSLRGRKRRTGESFYYPRVMTRHLAQVLTDEYSEHGVHVANVIIDGFIDSPGTRLHPFVADRPEMLIKPKALADAYWYLHTQDRSVWTHEIRLTPHIRPLSY